MSLRQKHHITRSLVRGARVATLRVRCSCNEFQHDAPRLSVAGRRKLDRLVGEHLVSANAGAINAALDVLARCAAEVPL